MKNDYSQLLIDIQKKSRITVQNVKDVKNLRDEIESGVNSNIGYNTMRRLFGFLPKTVPSFATLSLLSNYLGFTSYANYLNNKLNFDEWYFQQKLINFQLNKQIDTEVVATIEVGLTNKNNIVAVANLLSHYIRQNNIDVLHFLFKTIKFPKLTDGESLKFATIVTYNLLTIEKSTALNIYKKLLPIDNFRNLIPLFYIDYSNLTSIYGEVLGLIKQVSNQSSDLLFVDLMFYYKSFFQNETISNSKIITLPKNYNSFHDVLKGRYLAYLILKSNTIDEGLEKHILTELKNNQVSLISQEVIAALIIKEEYELLIIIFEKYYEDIFENVSWTYKTTNTINLIGLANVNWHQQKYSSAKKNLDLVELDKVELGYYDYFSLFFYLTQLKISYSEKDQQLNLNAQMQIKKYISKTNFQFFEQLANKFKIKTSTNLKAIN
jgi:hypothetical protein